MIELKLKEDISEPYILFPPNWSHNDAISWMEKHDLWGDWIGANNIHYGVFIKGKRSELPGGFDKHQAGAPPSSDDKSPHSATGEANRGTQEFASHSVGDRVQFEEGLIGGRKVTVHGTIMEIDRCGTALIRGDGGSYYCDLCALKNLSRKP